VRGARRRYPVRVGRDREVAQTGRGDEMLMRTVIGSWTDERRLDIKGGEPENAAS
jgi:hypothetical protein